MIKMINLTTLVLLSNLVGNVLYLSCPPGVKDAYLTIDFNNSKIDRWPHGYERLQLGQINDNELVWKSKPMDYKFLNASRTLNYKVRMFMNDQYRESEWNTRVLNDYDYSFAIYVLIISILLCTMILSISIYVMYKKWIEKQ